MLEVISFQKCADHSVSDKSKYSTFARTVPAEGEAAKAAMAFLRRYNWNKFAVVTLNDDVHNQLAAGIEVRAFGFSGMFFFILMLVSLQYWAGKYDMTIQNITKYSKAFNIDSGTYQKVVEATVTDTYTKTRGMV